MAKIHPNKEISAAIEYALENGYRFEKSNGHAFGRLLCPHNHRDGCSMQVWSTPRSPENHARRIVQFIDNCPHK
ncbi:MAG: hypothetical protein JKY95_11890 [Planctomycetaceae bacterium]|nr:hypothetical protein [Planctomycetaceae bacterium]